jgi:hypothetical protein
MPDQVSVSIRTVLCDPGVECYEMHFWCNKNSVASFALSMAVADGKQ